MGEIVEQPTLKERVEAILQLRAAGATKVRLACDGSPLSVTFGQTVAATPVQLVPLTDDVPPESDSQGVSDKPDPMEELVRAIQDGGEHNARQGETLVATRAGQ